MSIADAQSSNPTPTLIVRTEEIMDDLPMYAIKRAEMLIDEAKRLGLDGPTEEMITRAIVDAEYNALMFPLTIGARHGITPKSEQPK